MSTELIYNAVGAVIRQQKMGPARLLDIGAGAGDLICRLRSEHEMLDCHACDYYPESFRIGDVPFKKADIDEEISRLTTHFSEVRRVLNQAGAVGKRLDFLMQELHREANTLGSKSVAVETSRVSLELKVLIEQMREQVQNLE